MPGSKHHKETITHFTLEGTTHQVRFNKDVLRFLLNELARRYPTKLSTLAMVINRTRNKQWMSQDRSTMYRAFLIGKTGWYFDTNLKAEDVKRFSKQILPHLGLHSEEISFKSRNQEI